MGEQGRQGERERRGEREEGGGGKGKTRGVKMSGWGEEVGEGMKQGKAGCSQPRNVQLQKHAAIYSILFNLILLKHGLTF